jgi:hypothetical protein
MKNKNKKQYKVIVKYNCDLNKPREYNYIPDKKSTKGQDYKEFESHIEKVAYSNAIIFWFNCTSPITKLDELMPQRIFGETSDLVHILNQEDEVLEEELVGNIEKFDK